MLRRIGAIIGIRGLIKPLSDDDWENVTLQVQITAERRAHKIAIGVSFYITWIDL